MVSFPITEVDKKMCFFMGRKSRVGAIFRIRIQVTLRFTTPSAARAESVLLGVKQQVPPQAGYVGGLPRQS